MKQYAIFDNHQASLLKEYPVYSGKTPSEAVRSYLKAIGDNSKIKVSADIDVRIGAIPCVIENGKMYFLSGKRRTWFKAITEDQS